MTAAPHASLLDELRARTAPQHARLDAGFASAQSFTRSRYVALLRASLAVIEPIELALQGWLAVVAAAGRAARIRADLDALGETASVASAADWSIDDLPSAFGVAYVVEGSALGGIVLADRFERALGLPHDLATTYLRLHGRDTGRRWAGFLSQLRELDATFDRRDRDAACSAACATFAAYLASFVENGLDASRSSP